MVRTETRVLAACCYRVVTLVVSRVCGTRITSASDVSVALRHADVFGTVELRRTPSLDFRDFLAGEESLLHRGRVGQFGVRYFREHKQLAVRRSFRQHKQFTISLL